MPHLYFVWICFAFLLFQPAHATATEPTTPFEINHAELLLMDDLNQPPQIDSGWIALNLPDIWTSERYTNHREGWYRSTITLKSTPNNLWAVYLPRIRMNASVYLNGHLLGSGGRFSDPIARNWNRPLYFNVPVGLLKAGENIVHVRLASSVGNRVALYPYYFGADEVLRPDFDNQLFWQVDILKVLCAIAVLMGLLALLVWYRDPASRMYGWYAFGTLTWAMYIPYFFVRDIPVDAHAWIWFSFSSCFWMIAGMMLFVCHFIQYTPIWFYRLVIAYSAFSTAVVWLAEQETMIYRIALMFFGFMVIVIITTYWLLRHCWRTGSGESWLMLAAILSNVAFGIHDLLSLILYWKPPIFILHYGAPVMILVMGIILIDQFIRTMKLSRTMNRVMDQRLQAQKAALDKTHAEFHDIEKKHAIQQERERMIRDIHDGLGGHLVSALAMSEKGTHSEALHHVLKESLDELRMIIDTASSEGDDFDALISVMRHRYMMRCKNHHIELDWHAADAVCYLEISQLASLHLIRILQEAMTNIFKHANATHIKVRIDADLTHHVEILKLEISDNGKGINADAMAGHGLVSMHQRAREIGAEIHIANHSGGGVHVGIVFPLVE